MSDHESQLKYTLFQNLSEEVHLYYSKKKDDLLLNSSLQLLSFCASLLTNQKVKTSELEYTSFKLSMDTKFDSRLTSLFSEVYNLLSKRSNSQKISTERIYNISCKLEILFSQIYFKKNNVFETSKPKLNQENSASKSTEQTTNNSWEITSTTLSSLGEGESHITSKKAFFDGIESSFVSCLNRLSMSSSFVISSEGKFDGLQKYLHINRKMQLDFIDILSKNADKNGSKLIFLCGNVGDGKSHLLSYIFHSNRELYDKYSVINDATESRLPSLTAIDTLKEKLVDFKDINIKNSKAKIIVAINLGILKNFLDFDLIKNEFSLLHKYVNELGVLGGNQKKELETENFALLNIGNYQFIETSEFGVTSSYIDELLEKIICKDETNPFYNSYLEDKNNKIYNTALFNYELLFDSCIRKRICDLVIRSFIEHDQLLSMRSILNFFQNIIVGESDNSSIFSTLFNLIFTSESEDGIISRTSEYDPISRKSEIIDNILLEFLLEDNIHELLLKYTGFSRNQLDYVEELLTDIEFDDISSFLLRVLYLFPKNSENDLMNDLNYTNYLAELSSFNKNGFASKKVFDLVKIGILKWNGSYKEPELVFLNQSKSPVKLLQRLDIKTSKGILRDDFSRVINVDLMVDNKKFVVEVDYEVFSLLVKIESGYFPNKFDKEKAYRFDRSCSEIQDSGSRDSELYMLNSVNNKIYKFTYDPNYNEYSFERK